MTEEEFLRLIRKTEVQQLLCDMDVNVDLWEASGVVFQSKGGYRDVCALNPVVTLGI